MSLAGGTPAQIASGINSGGDGTTSQMMPVQLVPDEDRINVRRIFNEQLYRIEPPFLELSK